MATNTTTSLQVPTCYYALEPLPESHAYFTITFFDSSRASISPICLFSYLAQSPGLPDMLVHLHAGTDDIPNLIDHLYKGTKVWKRQPPVHLTFGSNDSLPITGTDQFSQLYMLLSSYVGGLAGQKLQPSMMAAVLTWFFGLTATELSLAQLRLHPRKLEAAAPAVEGTEAERGGEEIAAAEAGGAGSQHDSVEIVAVVPEAEGAGAEDDGEEIVAVKAGSAGSQHGGEETVAAVPEVEGAGAEEGGEESVVVELARRFSRTIRRPTSLILGMEPFPPPPNSGKARRVSWDSGVDVTMPAGEGLMAELLDGSMPDCADEMVKRDLHRRYLAGAVTWTCVGRYPGDDEVAICGGEGGSQ